MRGGGGAFIKEAAARYSSASVIGAPQPSQRSAYSYFIVVIVFRDEPSTDQGLGTPPGWAPPPTHEAAVRSGRYGVIEGFGPSGGITGSELKVGFNSTPSDGEREAFTPPPTHLFLPSA